MSGGSGGGGSGRFSMFVFSSPIITTLCGRRRASRNPMSPDSYNSSQITHSCSNFQFQDGWGTFDTASWFRSWRARAPGATEPRTREKQSKENLSPRSRWYGSCDRRTWCGGKFKVVNAPRGRSKCDWRGSSRTHGTSVSQVRCIRSRSYNQYSRYKEAGLSGFSQGAD